MKGTFIPFGVSLVALAWSTGALAQMSATTPAEQATTTQAPGTAADQTTATGDDIVGTAPRT